MRREYCATDCVLGGWPSRSCAVIFRCPPAGRASVGEGTDLGAQCSVCGRDSRGPAVRFLLLRRFGVDLPVGCSSCFVLVLPLGLCFDVLWLVGGPSRDQVACLFVNHGRT